MEECFIIQLSSIQRELGTYRKTVSFTLFNAQLYYKFQLYCKFQLSKDIFQIQYFTLCSSNVVKEGKKTKPFKL